jgi:hypothetical protein
MRVKLLTCRYSATLGGFDDTALTEFIRDKEVIAFREHFYTVNEVPHLSCIVHYQDAVVSQTVLDAAREIPARAQRASGNRPFERKQGAPDPCEGLDEGERALLEDGSRQEDLWGIDLYPDVALDLPEAARREPPGS